MSNDTRTLNRWRAREHGPWHIDDPAETLPDWSSTALCGVTVRHTEQDDTWAFYVGDPVPAGFCRTCWRALQAGGWRRASGTEDELLMALCDREDGE